MEDTTDFLRRHPIGHTQFLLDKARTGSDTAWREILRRYRTMLIYQIRWEVPEVMRRHLDKDDLLQSVFSKAWENILTFQYRREGSFRNYLSTLIVNECKNEMRARLVEGSPVDIELADPEGSTAAEELSEERRHLIEKMGELDKGDRDILAMRYFEDMSWDAIAEVLECSRDKAQSLYAQAFERLSRRLQE